MKTQNQQRRSPFAGWTRSGSGPPGAVQAAAHGWELTRGSPAAPEHAGQALGRGPSSESRDRLPLLPLLSECRAASSAPLGNRSSRACYRLIQRRERQQDLGRVRIWALGCGTALTRSPVQNCKVHNTGRAQQRALFCMARSTPGTNVHCKSPENTSLSVPPAWKRTHQLPAQQDLQRGWKREEAEANWYFSFQLHFATPHLAQLSHSSSSQVSF